MLYYCIVSSNIIDIPMSGLPINVNCWMLGHGPSSGNSFSKNRGKAAYIWCSLGPAICGSLLDWLLHTTIYEYAIISAQKFLYTVTVF